MADKKEIKDKIMTNVPSCCKGCVKWDKFGKECWVYWDLKKECTMHLTDWNDMALQQNL